MIILYCILVLLIILFIIFYTHTTYIFFTNNYIDIFSLSTIKTNDTVQSLYKRYGEGRVERVLNLYLKEISELQIPFIYDLCTTGSFSDLELTSRVFVLNLLAEDIKEELQRRYPRIK